ncbi:hypothetical protein NL676_020297 [Syzygium grande]|nr:hypothetical protein NL676_020297 [Syzygium grande]
MEQIILVSVGGKSAALGEKWMKKEISEVGAIKKGKTPTKWRGRLPLRERKTPTKGEEEPQRGDGSSRELFL